MPQKFAPFASLAMISSVVALLLAACSGASTHDATSSSSSGGASSSSGTLPDGAPAGDGGGSSGTTSSGGATPDGSDSSSSTSSSGGTLAFTSAVKIIVEPSDSGSALISAIGAAKTSVHMTMYLLTYGGPVYNALISAKSKAEVKVVLEQHPNGGNNNSSYNGLKAAGIGVVWSSPAYTFTHEKCVILDGATAWIMTMNAADSSLTQNREFLAVDTDADDVTNAEAIFQADYAALAKNTSGKLVLAPVNAKQRIDDLVKTATKTIDIEGEEFSDADLTNLLAAKADAGITVRLVVSNSTPSANQTAAIATLKQHKIPVKSLSTPYLHAKALVVDGVHAYVGSANFTAGSLTTNRELGVLFDTASEVAKVSSTIAADFAAGAAL